jgi:hypothetical protein
MQPSIQFVQVDLTHTDDEHNEERNNCMEEGEEGSNDHLHTREEGEEERRGVADLCFRARSATSRAMHTRPKTMETYPKLPFTIFCCFLR